MASRAVSENKWIALCNSEGACHRPGPNWAESAAGKKNARDRQTNRPRAHKTAPDYLRPGLASLFPRPSQMLRTDTPRRLPCPCQRTAARSEKGLLPGSELDESSIDPLVVHLTSKCRREDCQAKSEGSARFSRREQHIFWCDAPAATIGGVKFPIRRSEVIP